MTKQQTREKIQNILRKHQEHGMRYAVDELEAYINKRVEEERERIIVEIEEFHDATYFGRSKGTSEELAYRTALLELISKLTKPDSEKK